MYQTKNQSGIVYKINFNRRNIRFGRKMSYNSNCFLLKAKK